MPSVKDMGEVDRVSKEVVKIKINNRQEINKPLINPSLVIFKNPKR